MIEWDHIREKKNGEPVLVTSEHFPGWFDIGVFVGEWRNQHGELMRHEPTHWSMLTPVKKRKLT